MELKPNLPKEEDSFLPREYLKPFNECSFEEITYYYVWVSYYRNNPPFRAILYTGFESGSYRTLFTGSECTNIDHRAKFKIITKIGRSGH